MLEMTLAEIASAVRGKIIQGDADNVFSAVSTDTRNISEGSLFVALKGERFDAHDFLGQAVEKGAGGVLVNNTNLVSLPDHLSVIRVVDTLKALQDLACYNRQKAGLPVVAVTGSVGKTSTKDMIASVLEQKLRVLKTGGNFNNEIGLPLTLLEINSEHQIAVVEMGMRGLGEITALAQIARPDMGVITNIGETHIELLGSVDNIARAKGELLENLPATGTAILNGDDPQLLQLGAKLSNQKGFNGKVVYFGFEPQNELRAEGWHTEGAGANVFQVVNREGVLCSVRLPAPGKHNVLNALAATAVGLALGMSGVEIARGLETTKLSAMRLQIQQVEPYVIINDAYNANPASTRAALEVLADYPCKGKRVAVLGNMLELGEEGERGHRSVGAEVVAKNIDLLYTLGDLAEWIAQEALNQGMAKSNIHSSRTSEEISTSLRQVLQPGDVLLVKGSRGMKMEEIIQQL